MKKVIVLIVLLTLSCKNNKIERPEKPDNLIPKNKMVEVIYDMSIISSAKGINRNLIENKGIVPDQFVYNKHDIDSAQFSVSNKYYAYDIKEYQEIYNQVREKLEADKEKYQGLVEEEKRVRDSIAKDKKRLDSLRQLKNKRVGDTLFQKRINQSPLKKIDTSQ